MREQLRSVRLAPLKAEGISLIDEDRREPSDGKISRYKIPQIHMNSELTVTSGNPPNVCRDFWAFAHRRLTSEGRDEFATAMPRNSSSQNLSLNPTAAKGVCRGVEPLSVVRWPMRGGVQVL